MARRQRQMCIRDRVKTYNSFYQDFPILKELNIDSKSFRLCLSSLTARVLKNGMDILGIELPSRM